jgi:DNA-binding response OmpR family regulator
VKVFLVDDDYEEAELFEEALEQVDGSIRLTWFGDAKEASEALSGDQPDVIFLDLNIPQVSGKEFLKMLRENPVTKHTPVVIYSTSISKKDVAETSRWSVKSYLQKPENFNTLCAELREILLR